MELMGSISWNMNCLSRPRRAFLSSKRGFQLAVHKNKSFLEVMTMWGWTSSRWNMHVNETKSAGSIFSGHQYRIGVADNSKM